MALCQPLNATEIEVLQHLADGLGTAEIAASRSTTAQVIKNYIYRVPETRRRQSRASDRGGVSGGDYQMSHGADGSPPKCSLNGSAVFVVVALPREYN
jgi:hypothetical protein